MPSTLTLAKVREETRQALGESGVAVELEDKDIDKALKDAVRVYNHARPRHSKAALAVTPSQKKYTITHPGLQGVVQVKFVETTLAAQGSVDPFDPLTYRTTNPAAPNGYGDRELALGYIEYARTVASVEPEWHGQWEGTDYFLYVDVARPSLLCGYEYIWNLLPTDDTTLGIRHIDGTDEDWIMEYVLAKAKMTLVRVRGKLGGITNADGGVDQVDYQELRDEGREDLAALLERMQRRRRPLAPVTG